MKFRLFDSENNELILRAKSEFEAVQMARQRSFKLSRIEPFINHKIHTLSTKEKIFLFHQFALLLNAGLSINELCQSLVSAFRQKNVREFLKALQSALQSGQKLSLAFASMGFKPSESALIKMGESTGNLGFVFEKFAKIEEQNLKFKKQIKKALAYPCFVFLSLVAAFCVMILFVIPQFEAIFLDFGAPLPLITRLLLASYQFLSEFYLILLCAFSLLCLIFVLFYRHLKGFQFFIHALLLKLPLIKNMIFYSQNAVFFEIFALLFQSGTPLLDALNLARDSLSNLYLKHKISKIISLCQSGVSVETAFRKAGIYDEFVLAMLAAAMKSSRLDLMSEKIARYFESKQEDLNALFTALLEPLMTLLVCALVLILALGIFLPLWQLNEVVKL